MDPALLAFAFLGLLTVAVYAALGGLIARDGGKVPVKKFDMTDVLVGGLLAAFFVTICFQPQPKKIHNNDLVGNAVVLLVIVAFLCSFMYFRGFDLAAQFGLRWLLRPDRTAGAAFLLLLAFYPLFIFTGLLTQKIMGAEAKPQELIQFFSDAVRDGHRRSVFYMFITGGVVAPFAEEFIFRGYLYGVLKRYLGITAGVVLNAALFAGVHQSATSFAVLFLFAVCLTLAYEFTGSILVNMGMHSLFNLCSLTLVYGQAIHSPK